MAERTVTALTRVDAPRRQEIYDKHKLTLKMRGVLEEYLHRGEKEATIKALYGENLTPGRLQRLRIRYFNHKKMQKALTDVLEEDSLDDMLLLKKLREGLNATKAFRSVKDGRLLGTDPDFPSRWKFLDTFIKLKGKYARTEHTVNIEAGKTLEDLGEKIYRTIKEQEKKEAIDMTESNLLKSPVEAEFEEKNK